MRSIRDTQDVRELQRTRMLQRRQAGGMTLGQISFLPLGKWPVLPKRDRGGSRVGVLKENINSAFAECIRSLQDIQVTSVHQGAARSLRFWSEIWLRDTHSALAGMNLRRVEREPDKPREEQR